MELSRFKTKVFYDLMKSRQKKSAELKGKATQKYRLNVSSN
jgi:hypothetical protein